MRSTFAPWRRLAAVLLVAGCAGSHGSALVPPVAGSPVALDTTPPKSATMFVTSRGDSAILGFPSSAHGDATPSVVIAGNKTGLDEPIGFAFDRASGRIYASNDPGTSVLIFPKGANGNVAPQILGGSKVPIQASEGIAVDSSGEIYVSDYEASAIYVFAAGATGNSAPIRTIAGGKTRLDEPVGMAFDSKGHLYVANPYDPIEPILEFAAGATGNVAPIGVLHGKHTTIVSDFENISVDGHDRIVVANSKSILVFAAGAHGDVPPESIVEGPKTKIAHLLSVGTDSGSNIYASQWKPNSGKFSLLVFRAGAKGNEPPLRELAGPDTEMSDAHYPTFTSGSPSSQGMPDTTPGFAEFPGLPTIPDQIASDSAGNEWLAGETPAMLVRMNEATHAISQFALPNQNSDPYAVALGRNHTGVWFTELATNTIGYIRLSNHTIHRFAIPTGNADPYGITAGPDDAMWFTEMHAGKIGRIDLADDTITEYPIPGGGEPFQITLGQDGALWFTDYGGRGIGRVTRSHQFSSYAFHRTYFLEGITTASDGGIWFTGSSSEYAELIGRIDPYTHKRQIWAYDAGGTRVPRVIVSRGSTLWVTEQADAAIARFDIATHALSRYKLPSGYTMPLGISLGTDNQLWFTEQDESPNDPAIGKLCPELPSSQCASSTS
ncbi:MAG TPA: hypothetical protein VFE16_06995 [Candidatus Cybelea sp.]|jgi:virginiamycin B lyase|nr:hypothetical protein [Candidatus Cybelea sp.]